MPLLLSLKKGLYLGRLNALKYSRNPSPTQTSAVLPLAIQAILTLYHNFDIP